MLLALLLSALVAASEPGEDADREALLAGAPAESLALLADLQGLRFDEPVSGGKSSSEPPFNARYLASISTLSALQAYVNRAGQDPGEELAADLALAWGYEALFDAILYSPVPTYLTGDAAELYRMSLEDLAHEHDQQRVRVYSRLLNQAIYYDRCDISRYAFDRLSELDPAQHRGFEERLPEPPPRLAAGFAELKCRDFLSAEAVFRRALEADPMDTTARLGLAIALRHGGQEAAAAAVYESLRRDAPGDRFSTFNAALFYSRAGRYREAGEVIDDFIMANPGIGPKDEIFDWKAIFRPGCPGPPPEEISRKQAEKAAREAKQREEFASLQVKFASLKLDLEAYASCPAMIEAGGVEAGLMIAEQIQPIIDANEIDMAGDVMPFLDDLQPQIDALKPQCPRP